MVYVTPLVMGWRPFVTSWLAVFHPEKLSAEARTLLMSLFNKHMDDALKFRAKEAREPVPVTDITVTTSVCRLFEALFSPDKVNFAMPFVTELTPLLQQIFVFAMAWAFGGSMDAASQAKLRYRVG